jgi:eukaryotic-like serine/threonine-protein kinase
MDPEHWQKIKNVLAGALETAPADRAVYLDQSCAGDDSVRREVETLLDQEHDVGSHFLNQAALAEVTAAVLPTEGNRWIGRRFGAYKSIEQIGAGGMGEVYRAVRADDQYSKQVALKLIRAGQDSGFVIARFKNERQILATLDHPNIARLLDGGTTEEGMPYLVMELIEGRPIGEYCDASKLSITDRLNLFIKVCSAVQYAHQRLVIHRDIKPGNILVTADGIPKLLDFGIAKIVDVDGESTQAERTLTMFRILTPLYASPEQVRGEAITTASDVYSLGVVLYELLTGRSPYPKTGGAPKEVAHAVCEFEPIKPSTVVRTVKAPALGANPDSTVDSDVHVGPSPEKLAKQLSGDLDNVVLMALRKEPERRYASVDQFAEDIRRYLAKLPVAARKDTPRYRASKFVARHKAGVVAAVAIALTLVAGLVITVREARVAQRRFNDVRSLANSLIFDVHDSIKDLPGSTPARKIIVDRALQYLNVLAQESAGDIGLQRELATAYEKVGSVQGDYLENNLGDYAGTLTSYKKVLGIRNQIGAASSDWNDHVALATAYRLVAHQQWANGDTRGARDNIAHAIAISEGLAKAQPDNYKILYELGFDFEVSARIGYPEDRLAEQKTLDDYRRALAADDILVKLKPNDANTLHGYAMDLNNMGNILESSNPQGALSSYEKALEINQKLTEISPEVRYRRSVAIAYGSIASVYDDLGDYERAVENDAKDLAIYQDLNRADPKNALLRQGLAIAYANAATAGSRAGKMESALDYSSKGVEIMRTVVASATENAFQRGVFAAILASHGTVLISAGRSAEAIPVLANARSIYESLSKSGSTFKRANVAACNVKLGEAEAQAKHEATAADYFHQALAVAEPLISTDPPDPDALYAAADAYSGLGSLSIRKAQQRGQTTQLRKANWTEAKTWDQRSLDTWHRIDHPNHAAPNSFQAGDPLIVAKELKTAEAALSSLP